MDESLSFLDEFLEVGLIHFTYDYEINYSGINTDLGRGREKPCLLKSLFWELDMSG